MLTRRFEACLWVETTMHFTIVSEQLRNFVDVFKRRSFKKPSERQPQGHGDTAGDPRYGQFCSPVSVALRAPPRSCARNRHPTGVSWQLPTT